MSPSYSFIFYWSTVEYPLREDPALVECFKSLCKLIGAMDLDEVIPLVKVIAFLAALITFSSSFFPLFFFFPLRSTNYSSIKVGHYSIMALWMTLEGEVSSPGALLRRPPDSKSSLNRGVLNSTASSLRRAEEVLNLAAFNLECPWKRYLINWHTNTPQSVIPFYWGALPTLNTLLVLYKPKWAAHCLNKGSMQNSL